MKTANSALALACMICIPAVCLGFEATHTKAKFISRTEVTPSPRLVEIESWDSNDAHTSIAVNRAGDLFVDSSPVEEGGEEMTTSFRGSLPEVEMFPETWNVHGKDGRTRIHSTTNFPYRAMGMLANGCTGTLIGPRHVLTAAHCVYDTDTDSWESNLDFYPARNGSSRPYGRYSWKNAVTVKGFTKSHLKKYDYALVILREPAGDSVGWMGYGYTTLKTSHNVNINGYPEDKSYGTLWHSFCDLVSVGTHRLTHNCDTEGGMSGSAMYVYRDGKRVIYGVHTHGGALYNYGTRITSSKFDQLKKWKEEYR